MAAFILPFDWSIMKSYRLQNKHRYFISNDAYLRTEVELIHSCDKFYFIELLNQL